MSGFGAVAAEDSTAAARETAAPVLEALRWRGPDASAVWAGDRALLMHTQFRTTRQSAGERQPITNGPRYAIAGDVRLDARDALCAVLAVPADAASTIPDIELILLAWRRWGRDCVRHLLGDFAFVVWDIEARRLFAARDHFGVRPLYYAYSNRHIIVANMIAAVRRHPAVPDDLDDEAVVDWLTFEYFERPESTPFAAVKRLPGGHTLEWQDGTCTVRRYWDGPGAAPVRYKRDDEYVERYRELLDRAVADRLRTDSVSVAMTGGLDSSSIAASAVHVLGAAAVRAATIVYDHLIPDDERRFAGLVADALGVRHTMLAADDRPVYDRLRDAALMPPEPVDDPFRAMLTDFYGGLAAETRVMLMGLDGDTFLNEVASDYLLARLRRGEVGEYLRGVTAFVRTRRELPPHRVRSTIRQWLGKRESTSEGLPAWLAPEAVARFDVARRWAGRPAARPRAVDGWPLRARATSVLASPIWPAMFDHHDAEHLGVLIEARFPLADLRLVDYLMNIPAVPWCVDKYVARRALADRLPREVLTRPKAPLGGDTVRARIERGDRLPWTGAFRPHPRLSRFVDADALAGSFEREAAEIATAGDTRALMLNEWLWYHFPRS